MLRLDRLESKLLVLAPLRSRERGNVVHFSGFARKTNHLSSSGASEASA
ncbi:MAG: hypothetical protein U5L45_04125 [Saprospiraceae bacterium]|nr:hypothetical protein [Saprospiraceae bacterium]